MIMDQKKDLFATSYGPIWQGPYPYAVTEQLHTDKVIPTLSTEGLLRYCDNNKQEPLFNGGSSMTSFGPMLVKADQLAKKSGLPLEKFIQAVAVFEADREEEEKSRRSTQEEKLAIDKQVDSYNGAISEDLPPIDILKGANVRINQGTRSYATRAKKQALLTYQTKK